MLKCKGVIFQFFEIFVLYYPLIIIASAPVLEYFWKNPTPPVNYPPCLLSWNIHFRREHYLIKIPNKKADIADIFYVSNNGCMFSGLSLHYGAR